MTETTRPAALGSPLAAGGTAPRRLWATVFAATLLCRLPSFFHPILDADEATFGSVAALMNAGGRLYGDGGVDNKFPGIFWTYALVFRGCGRYAMTAVHALSLLTVLVTALLLARVARRLAAETGGDPRRAAFFAALLYGVFSSVMYPKMIAANTEVFMNLPLAASMLVALRALDGGGGARSGGSLLRAATLWWVAGLLVALACLWKQVAVVSLPVLVGAPLVAKNARGKTGRLAAATLVLAGGAIGFLAAAGIVAQTGSLDGMWHWTVARVLSHYGPSAWHPSEMLVRAAGGILSFAGAALLPVMAGVRAAFRLGRAGSGARLAVAWLIASAVGVVAGGRFFGHYFLQVLPPLAVLAAIEIDRRLTRTPARRLRLAQALLGLAVALPGLAFAAWATGIEPITERLGRPHPDYLAVAAEIRGRTRPDERVFIWGIAGPFYVAADRLPATRFVGFLRGLTRDRGEPPEHAWDAGPEVWALLAEDFRAHPPALVVDTSPANYFDFRAYPMTRFPSLAKLVVDGYRACGSLGGVDFYCRR